MTRKARFILTRPPKESENLARELAESATWLWPAFTFAPPSDMNAVNRTLSNLSRFDAFLFVSPTAVSFAHVQMPSIPPSVTVCCAGGATARAVQNAWGPSVRILCPEGQVASSGSESLFKAMKIAGLPKSLLIFRAQSGREWLSEQLIDAGVHIEKLCIYERIPFTMDTEKKEALKKAMQEEYPVLLLTSTEAVGVFKRALEGIPDAFGWLQSGRVLTIHPRCVQALKESGFSDVILAGDTEPETLARALKKLAGDGNRVF